MKNREKDKRLLIPKDDFEEEASEGLGKLSRDEAEEDLRALRGLMERRLRKPRTIWLPAAAAVILLLVTSAIYVTVFREPEPAVSEIALMEEVITDTAMIAMAKPLKRVESQSTAPTETLNRNVSTKSATEVPAQDIIPVVIADEAKAKEEVQAEAKAEVAEEVIVDAMPMTERAVHGIAAAQSDKKARATVVSMPNLGVATGIHQPEPVGGMEEFNSWVEKNIRYPEGITPRLQQEVVINFTVASDGTLTDMRAEETPGEEFAKEAFRLLREGPKWIPSISEGKEAGEQVRISIVFR